MTQLLEGRQPGTRVQQLEDLLEDARRGHPAQQPALLPQGSLAGRIDVEAELGGKAHGAQHAHRVLPIAQFRIGADQAQAARLEILQATGVVDHGKIGDVVIEGIDREVPPQGVLLPGAIEVVADDHAVFEVAVARFLVILQAGATAAEGRHLDNFGAEMDMGQTEAATDQATVAEDAAHLLGAGVGGHVEVLGLPPQEQIAHPAADQQGLEALLFQAIEDLEGVLADVGAGNGVLVTRHDAAGREVWIQAGVFSWRERVPEAFLPGPEESITKGPCPPGPARGRAKAINFMRWLEKRRALRIIRPLRYFFSLPSSSG